jgi:threonine/homoserine/homoserine lactone efflux protein
MMLFHRRGASFWDDELVTKTFSKVVIAGLGTYTAISIIVYATTEKELPTVSKEYFFLLMAVGGILLVYFSISQLVNYYKVKIKELEK